MSAAGVYGVDFSGAADAGKAIWIAEAVERTGFLSIRACYAARDLPDSGVERTIAISALRSLIAANGDAVFGIDLPFGLPVAVVQQRTWVEFVKWIVGGYRTPDEFKAACWTAAGGAELRRKTDKETRTPFCAYNLRLYKQTFHGLTELIGPLVLRGDARAVPMQAPAPNSATLVEVCPASTLLSNGVYEPYKGPGFGAARARLVEWLVRSTPMAIPARIRALAVEEPNGDAVDSLIAAGAAARAVHARPALSAAHRLEGYVYV